MQRLLSYVVESPDELFLEDHLLALGPGTNAFTVTVEDREGFRKRLTDAGCTIRQENVLDDLEAIEPVAEIAAARAAALPPPVVPLQLPRGR